MLNFGLDTILLMLCAVVLKRNYKWWRLLLGGFIGSLIVLLMFTPFSHLMVHPAIKILFSFYFKISSLFLIKWLIRNLHSLVILLAGYLFLSVFRYYLIFQKHELMICE